MARTPTDYKKLYKESNELFIEQQANLEFAIHKIDELENKHKNLNKEFDKAVEINKRFQHDIIEQRGVIAYLELQIQKLDDEIYDLEHE
jgi:hypothetical protein